MSYLPVGSILDHRNDPNRTSTGPHLDIKFKRGYGDQRAMSIPLSSKPGLAQAAMRVGPMSAKALIAYQITSGYGNAQRHRPNLAHRNHFALRASTTASVLAPTCSLQGEGRYSPENTVGVIYTKDADGNPYEVELTHTKLGQASGGVTDDGSPSVVHNPDEDGSFTPQVQAKERAQEFISRKRTAGDVVDGFGNGFDQMKSTALADNLRSAQEAIIQKRMDAGESFGSISVPKPQNNNG